MSDLNYQKSSITAIAQTPVIHTITIQISKRKWQGCIYISVNEMTGQLIQFIKSKSGEHNGQFLNNPIYVLNAPTKSALEAKITSQIKSILTKKIYQNVQ